MAPGYLLHYVSNQRKRRETKAVEVRRARTRFGRGRWLYVDSTDIIPESGDEVGTCANATSRKRRDGIITYGTRLERADKFAMGTEPSPAQPSPACEGEDQMENGECN
ncbi:hypothetical protein C1H46_030114 [Malus baccata]|uniref:Uncharacterized protein n=1 Tax=Malus baccata TaxID=106549 RepID=A0A540LCY0_MALBA|nr:hypothetical protein C1H46_030114 [Malus baccata]